ncbi:MAG TPA: hypothetical protein VEK07_07075 [Polyangiaceae bacterium]|nr:hypothetical protein [Polyangiaceae bacterium]
MDFAGPWRQSHGDIDRIRAPNGNVHKPAHRICGRPGHEHIERVRLDVLRGMLLIVGAVP